MEGRIQRETYKRANERYMLIHKNPVGPKTADTLSFFFDKLSYSEQPYYLYVAGWSAMEAGLVATDKPDEWRRTKMQDGQTCWELARESELQRMALSAERKHKVVSSVGLSRIDMVCALGEVLMKIPGGELDTLSVRQSYDKTLSVAEENIRNLGDPDQRIHASNIHSFAFEIGSILACNRLLSHRLIAIPAFARADNGDRYPRETHDIQVLSLRRGKIQKTTPIEVKSTLTNMYFDRYDAALIGGHHDLLMDDRFGIDDFVALLRKEFEGLASDDEVAYLERTTDSIIHSIRHYSRAEEFGRHCVQIDCTIPHARYDEYSVA